MVHASGRRVGPYEIAAPIGRGAMGEVYGARDVRSGRAAAIKVPAADADHAGRERFEAAARAASRLTHPNIVTTYEVGRDDGVPYVAMELVEGMTLRDRLDAGRPTIDQAVDWAMQMADGLSAAHAAGLIHRDLKPGNIIVTTDDRVKLLDFGLARVTAGEDEPARDSGATLTLPGTVLGTVAYMAPEQVRGLAVDHRADIFACGVVLFEMLAGTRPFDGDTSADTMSAVLTAAPPDLSVGDPAGVPPALARVVARCLEKDAARRFQSAADLRFALEQLRLAPGHVGVAAAGQAVRSRRPSAWLAAGALGGLAVAMLLASGRGRTDPIDDAPITRFDVPIPQPASSPLHVRLSPDGRRVLIGGGQIALWTHDLSTNQARRLTETPANGVGGWSPDRSEVLLVVEGQLVRASADGLRITPIAEVTDFFGADWYGDDVIFADANAIRRIRPGGSGAEVVCEGREELTRIAGPAVSGAHVFFYAEGPTPERTGVYAGRLDGPCAPRFVAEADSWPVAAAPDRLFYARRSTVLLQALQTGSTTPVGQPVEVAFDVRYSGRRAVFDARADTLVFRRNGAATPRQLRVVNRAGGGVREVGTPGLFKQPSLARDGSAVLATRLGGRPGVVSIDSESGIETPLTSGAPARFTRWSPDRAFIAYGEQVDGGFALVVKPARLDGARRVLHRSRTLLAVVDWSGDGQFILFEHGDRDNESDLYAVRADGSAAPFPISAEQGYDSNGAFSPDGRFVAYSTLNQRLFVRGFPDGPILQRVTIGTGLAPRWHPNGRTLFFIDPRPTPAGWRVMSVPFQDRGSKPPAIGTPVPLFTARLHMADEYSNLGAPYDVAADGEHFLILETTGEITEPIGVVLNWERLRPRP